MRLHPLASIPSMQHGHRKFCRLEPTLLVILYIEHCHVTVTHSMGPLLSEPQAPPPSYVSLPGNAQDVGP